MAQRKCRTVDNLQFFLPCGSPLIALSKGSPRAFDVASERMLAVRSALSANILMFAEAGGGCRYSFDVLKRSMLAYLGSPCHPLARRKIN